MNKRLASMLAAFALTLSPVVASADEPVKSPENTNDITLIEATGGPADADVVLTPYADKDKEGVPAKVKDQLEQTFGIVTEKPVTELADGIEDAFEKAKKDNPAAADLTVNDLKVADIFDVSYVKDGNVVDVNNEVTIKVQTDLRPGDVFVVLHNADGTMQVVPAEVDNSGVLTIKTPSLSAFTILVAEKAQTPAPGPGGDTNKPGPGGDTNKPGPGGDTNKPGGDTNKPGGDTNKPGGGKPGSGNVDNTNATKPAKPGNTATQETPKATGVATAANSNSMMAYVGAAAGLAGILLILKARKGLAK